jgi:hypothetical protein
MVLACLLLGLSGGVRFWRDHQFAVLSSENKGCPFPLVELPKVLGTWHVADDSEMQLDPETARIAGSTDHIIRTYVDSRTGEKIHVLVLYGLAEDVYPHTPEVCYPASGHQAVTQAKENLWNIPGVERPVDFRSQVYYRRGSAGDHHYYEVCYAFRHGGTWKPDMSGEWKKFRYVPGMFKIQTTREVTAGAASPDAAESDVSKSLIIELVQDLERRIASSTGPNTPQG